MPKKKSFIHHIFIYLLILTGLLILVLGAFLASSYGILENEISASSNAFLTIYSNEFKNQISEMDSTLKSITTQGESLAKIKSSNENDRTLSSISLKNYMQNLITGNNAEDIIVIYDNNYKVCLDVIAQGFNYIMKNNLREFTQNALQNDKVRNYEWDFLKINNEIYMYKMLLTDDRAIAIYIRTNRLLNELFSQGDGNRTIALVDDSGMIGKVWGNESKDITAGANISNINMEKYYLKDTTVVDNQLSIYCFTRKNSILQQTHTSMLIVAISVLISVLYMLFIILYTRKEIAVPMQLVVNNMEKIKDGAYYNRIDIDFKTKEFQMLQETTNQMVDEIMGLKIQTYEKQIELKDMELKSIRLQLKPHFFLNALTTIASLSTQNKNDQIKIYIDALSKNVRYMFRAGFHTISIREEIKHVENYFEMQELKYPGCIFYLIDLPKDLEEWKIPQMLIHTFIENEYKYAVSLDRTLTILIKINKQSYKGEDMLLIEIEDDGEGYPKEVLDYMACNNGKSGENGTRIGLWSIKRMMELMYDRQDLLLITNINPHGCLNRIYVPRTALHEVREEAIHTNR